MCKPGFTVGLLIKCLKLKRSRSELAQFYVFVNLKKRYLKTKEKNDQSIEMEARQKTNYRPTYAERVRTSTGLRLTALEKLKMYNN